jgi:cobalt transporter subunit CbtB
MSVLAKSVASSSTRLEALRYGLAGFAHYPAIHDAAHDTRHAVSFPCH